MSENVIDAYIEYLRNISRKIVTRASFINVLPEESRNRFNLFKSITGLEDFYKRDTIPLTNAHPLYKYFKATIQYLDSNKDIRLFMGSGLLIGTFHGKKRNTNICSPLLYGLIDVEFSEDRRDILISLDFDSFQLNHDLLSRLFDISDDIDEESEIDEAIPDIIFQKFNSIDIIESKHFDSNNEYESVRKILADSTTIFNELCKNVPEFRKMDKDKANNFVYKERFNSKDSNITFYPLTFLFASKVPDQLSTYESLNVLLRQKPIKNKLLNKLFKNVLTNSKSPIDLVSDITKDRLNEVIESFLPMKLSENQKIAVQKAWESEVSFVQGPPGTGKSFTICSIILSAIFLDKSVLLVSHKKAALDVVKRMVDDILGADSMLYIGTENKIKTKEYIDSLLQNAGRMDANLLTSTEDIDDLSDRLSEMKEKIKTIIEKKRSAEKELIELTDAVNRHYNSFNKFLKSRLEFEKEYSISNIKEYYWNDSIRRHDGYTNSLVKIETILRKNSRNRLEQLFLAKVARAFSSNFSCDIKLILSDHFYSKRVFDINCEYSQAMQLIQDAKVNRLPQLRKNVHSIESDIYESQIKYLPLYHKYQILSKLFGEDNKTSRENLSSFRKMLHFKRADLLKKKLESIDYVDLLRLLPVWCSELRDLGKVIPMQNELFDLIIVDESSQVNISEAIPAFYRGKRYCIVGDKKQLNLNATGVGFSVSKSFEKMSWQHTMSKNNTVISYDSALSRDLLVTQSSILDFISSESNDFNIPSVSLDEHYRSLPQLASFTSKLFYSDKWKIMTENGENMAKNCFKAIKVDGVRDNSRKLIMAEIMFVGEVLSNLRNGILLPELEPFQQSFKNGKPSIGIVSFLTQQVMEMRNLFDVDFFDTFKEYDIFIATPEEFQGNERDVIFITLGLDGVSNWWGKAFYENENRFNVATSRAKVFTYLVYSGIPQNVDLIAKYLRHFGLAIDTSPEKIELVTGEPQYNRWTFDENMLESDFEFEVLKYLKGYIKSRNAIQLFNQVNACGQKRLDFVLFNTVNKKTCAVEVDGRDHFVSGTGRYTESHLQRIETLKRAGWQIVNVKYYNWWENGWISDENNEIFKNEIERLFSELDEKLLTNTCD